MKVTWKVEPNDIARLTELHQLSNRHPFVERRHARNVRRSAPRLFSNAEIWRVHLGCLLTTQQRSGAGSRVALFLEQRPFPLDLTRCCSAMSCERLVRDTLTQWGGIRRADTIARAARTNLDWLNSGGWSVTRKIVKDLKRGATRDDERAAARMLAENLSGIGPKQSRNMLQWLGLTQFEIPLDSRVFRWLNDFGFPIHLSSVGLSDPSYYEFVLDGVQKLCAAANVLPCELDAMIFIQREPEDWIGE